MCGRYALHSKPEVVALQFGLESAPQFAPSCDIAPAANVLIVRQEGAALARWGLRGKMHNARAETLGVKPSFRKAYHRRRCLVPANGFYEWKREGALTQPYYIHPAGGELFAFAGLWDSWHGMESCTVITTEANATMRSIHDRMPVIIAPGHYAGWLHGEEGLLRPAPAGAIRCYPVHSEVQKSLFD